MQGVHRAPVHGKQMGGTGARVLHHANGVFSRLNIEHTPPATHPRWRDQQRQDEGEPAFSLSVWTSDLSETGAFENSVLAKLLILAADAERGQA